MKVFLGGTCNGSRWREAIQGALTQYGIAVLDPRAPGVAVGPGWQPWQDRVHCDVCLYVFTPRQVGVLAAVLAMHDAHTRGERTMVCVLPEDGGQRWTEEAYRDVMQAANAMEAIGVEVVTRGLPGVVTALRRRQVPPPVPAILRQVVRTPVPDPAPPKRTALVCDHCHREVRQRFRFRGERWCPACLNPDNGPRTAVEWAAENPRQDVDKVFE